MTRPKLNETAYHCIGGKSYIDFIFEIENAHRFFDNDWFNLGYDSFEEFKAVSWPRLLVRFCTNNGTWEAKQLLFIALSEEYETQSVTYELPVELNEQDNGFIKDYLKDWRAA